MPNPFTSLLDLDQERLPGLRLRLGGEEYPLRPPAALPLAHALRLGDLYALLRNRRPGAVRFDAVRFDAVVQEITAIVAPGLPVALGRGQARDLAAFYSGHWADFVERMTMPAGDPVPFSAPARRSSRRPASARDSASDSESNSPCP